MFLSNQIARKKLQYRNCIRHEWINNHYKAIRQDIIQASSQTYHNNVTKINNEKILNPNLNNINKADNENTNKKILLLLTELPGSINKIMDCLVVDAEHTVPCLAQRIETLNNNMCTCTVVQWLHYMYILNRMIVHIVSRQWVNQLAQCVLSGVLNNALGFLGSDKIMSKEIMEILMQFMFRLGQSINLTNYLEILLISELVVKGMRITCSVETKLTILLVMNNLLRPEAYLTFIGNNQVVDNCSESSVSLQRQLQHEHLKQIFIYETFFKDVTMIRNMFEYCLGYIADEQKAIQLIDTILRILINLTLFTSQQLQLIILLDCHIGVLLNMVLVCYKQHEQFIVSCMRVINNLCVVTCGLTLRVFEEINFRKIVGRFEEGVGWEGRVEILELIIVVCCVGAGESQLLKTCCEVGGDRVLLGGLEMAKDGLEDSVVEKLLNAILVVKDDQPEKYGMILKDRVEDLKCVAERSEDIRSMVGCILQGLGLGLEQGQGF